MNIPMTADGWVRWKLSSRDGRTHYFSESALMEDAQYDLPKEEVRVLQKTLRQLVAEGVLKRLDNGFVLADRERYTDVHIPDVPPFELSAETIALQKRLREDKAERLKAKAKAAFVKARRGFV